MGEDQKREIENKEPDYAFYELFVYGQHDLLTEYEIKYKNDPVFSSKSYFIDFKEAFTITSKKIQRGATYPKKMQLSIKSRGELRNKLARFYARIPAEDLM